MSRTMVSTAKILLLPLGIVLLIAVIYFSSNNSEYADDTENNVVEPQIIQHRMIRRATIHYCKCNQYYDQEEGRCLGVPGGGKVLHVENRRSCGINVLKPHCRSSLYYHICKRDKSILAQCANRQIFDNRLQRCVYYDSSKLIPNIILPVNYMHYDHVNVPSCTRSGRFPVPGQCSMFYTCDTNGHRFYQSVFRCPQNTGYEINRGVCNIVSGCVNDNSVNTTVCVPNAPGENVESPRLGDAAEGNVKEIPEILDENRASTNDPVVESEETENSKTYDDAIATTPVNIIGTLSENNYNDNDSSLKPVEEDLVPNGIDEKIIHSQAPNPPEIVQKAFDEEQNEDGLSSLLGSQITSPSTSEFDDAPHSITTPVTSINPEYRTNTATVDSETTDTASFPSDSYLLSKLGEETQDVTTERYENIEDSAATLSSFNTEATDTYPAISNVPEITDIPSISDVPSKINEEMQDAIMDKNNPDSTVMPSNFNVDSTDLYPASVSNVPDSSPISNVPPSLDEKLQDAAMEQYENEDSVLTPSNFNVDSTDLYPESTVSNVPDSSPISNVSPSLDEKLQDAAMEQYENEDSVLTPSNFNVDSTDLYPESTVSNVPDSSPISNVSPSLDEKLQDTATDQNKNYEDSVLTKNSNTDLIDSYPTPTISNVPDSSPISNVSPSLDEKLQDAAMEQYENEDSVLTPSNFNVDSTDLYPESTVSNVPDSSPISNVSPSLDEKLQDTATDQNKNYEDSVLTKNSNTDLIDSYPTPTISNVPDSSPISNVSPSLDEKLQDAAMEQYENEDSVLTPSNFNVDSTDLYPESTVSNVPDSSPISNVSPSLDEKLQDTATDQNKNYEDSVLTKNSNTDLIDSYPTPTISNVPDSSLISNLSPSLDEKLQESSEQYKNGEDSVLTPSNFNTNADDLYPAPTAGNVSESFPISDVSPNIDEKLQDDITEQYRNNEDSAVTPSNFNTDSINLYPTSTVTDVPESFPVSDVSQIIDEKMQNTATEQSGNNEDSVSNFNTDSIDLYPTSSSISESSPISDTLSKLDEETQNIAPEMNRKEDRAVTLSNLSAEVVDPNLTSALNDAPATIDSPNNDDFDVLSSTPAILPPEAAVDQPTTEELSEAVPTIDNKFADVSMSTPDQVESVSTPYLPENTDDLTPMTDPRSTLISEDITAPMDVTAATIPSIQDSPISDTDLVTQNGKDSTEASPVSLTE
ncbi:cell wall protein DAN4 isoform X1 [Solenopsis invicta]|uniref:cell wall protein DAN4 isoform X1 n=1 Tax=Solenopsis invicta TaxID=13686 RepID=UPI00193EBC71|nr:cell wall protein DAN4 isoform X1 [Solenopsis invicta]